MSARYDTIPNCPLWIKNRKYRPSEYIKLYEDLKDPTNGTVKSDKVSALLFKSGLHPQELARIWLLLNNNGGQLSEQEFVIVLALIGFGQKGTQIKDLNSLFRIGNPPVPDLSKGYSSNTISCPATGDDDDDEFSDFQSAVVQTKMTTTVSIKPLQPQVISTSTSIPRRSESHGYMNFNSIDTNTKQFAPAPANINRNPTSQIQTQSTKTNELILIGDEDKYSALRDLMELNITYKTDDETKSNHNEISKTKGNIDDDVKRNLNDCYKSVTITNIPLKSHDSFGNSTTTSSADFDFGDFQSFSKPSPSIGTFYSSSNIAQTSSIGKSLPLVVSQKSHGEPEPPKPQAISPQSNHNWDDGDYGDFVSFKSDPVEKPSSKSDNVLSTVFELKQPLKLNPSELLLDMDISSHIPSLTPPHSTNSNKDNTKPTFPLLDLDQLDPFGSSLQSSNGPCSKEGASSNSLSFQICSDLQSLNFPTTPIPLLKTTLIGTLEPNLNNNGNSYTGSSEDLDSPSDFPLTNIPIPSTSKFKLDNFHLEDPNTTTKIKKQLNINSPETLSIASLELGNYGDNYSIDALQIQNTQPNSPGINSLSKEEPASTTGAKQQVDKYCSFRDELELVQHEELSSSAGFRSETDNSSNQKSTLHWEKILQVCINLLQQTQLAFSSTSTEVLGEILCSSRGEDFMMDLIQLNTLASRIYYSWMKHGPTEVLGKLHQKLEVAWDSLVPFININDQTDNFIKKFKPEIKMFTQHENPTNDSNVCCICLFGTMDNPNSSEDEHWSILLDFHGKLYHLPCANLWLNEIDQEGLPNDFSI